MDEVALSGLLQITKFVQMLHPYMPKAWFEIFAFLALVYICSGLPIVVGTGTVLLASIGDSKKRHSTQTGSKFSRQTHL
jgi:hypothetical protein